MCASRWLATAVLIVVLADVQTVMNAGVLRAFG